VASTLICDYKGASNSRKRVIEWQEGQARNEREQKKNKGWGGGETRFWSKKKGQSGREVCRGLVTRKSKKKKKKKRREKQLVGPQ